MARWFSYAVSALVHVSVVIGVAQIAYDTPPKAPLRAHAHLVELVVQHAPPAPQKADAAPSPNATVEKNQTQPVKKPSVVAKATPEKQKKTTHKPIAATSAATPNTTKHNAGIKSSNTTRKTGSASDVISKPYAAQYLNNPAPKYPRRAKRKKQEGTVLLRVNVSAQGTVSGLHMLQSSGYEALDSSAIKTVRHWKFIPAKRGNSAIAASVNVPIIFQLK